MVLSLLLAVELLFWAYVGKSQYWNIKKNSKWTTMVLNCVPNENTNALQYLIPFDLLALVVVTLPWRWKLGTFMKFWWQILNFFWLAGNSYNSYASYFTNTVWFFQRLPPSGQKQILHSFYLLKQSLMGCYWLVADLSHATLNNFPRVSSGIWFRNINFEGKNGKSPILSPFIPPGTSPPLPPLLLLGIGWPYLFPLTWSAAEMHGFGLLIQRSATCLAGSINDPVVFAQVLHNGLIYAVLFERFGQSHVISAGNTDMVVIIASAAEFDGRGKVMRW